MSFEPNMSLHLVTARTYLTDSFAEFEGLGRYAKSPAQLLGAAEALGAQRAEGSKPEGKSKGTGNPYPMMLKIVSAIRAKKSQALIDMASTIDVVTVNNIGPTAVKTRELYERDDAFKDLANGKKMTSTKLIEEADQFGKNAAAASIVYGLLNADTTQTIIGKCLDLCPAKVK